MTTNVALRPMRETVRRKLIARTVAETEPKAASAIATLLDRRYKVLKRELRRANLRKTLAKNLRDTGSLFKQGDDQNWLDWINSFSLGVKDALNPIVFGVYDTEGQYWANRGQRLDPLDPNKVFAAYEARTGRQISDIADDTRKAVLANINDWYNSDASLPELIDSLGQYFSPERAEMIARTESAFIVSEINRTAMTRFGVKQWDFDLAADKGAYPCAQCIAYAAENPHDINDEFPPLHPGDRCGVVYLFEDGEQ